MDPYRSTDTEAAYWHRRYDRLKARWRRYFRLTVWILPAALALAGITLGGIIGRDIGMAAHRDLQDALDFTDCPSSKSSTWMLPGAEMSFRQSLTDNKIQVSCRRDERRYSIISQPPGAAYWTVSGNYYDLGDAQHPLRFRTAYLQRGTEVVYVDAPVPTFGTAYTNSNAITSAGTTTLPDGGTP